MIKDWIDIDEERPPLKTKVVFTCNCSPEGWTEPRIGHWEGGKTIGKAIIMEDDEEYNDWFPCTHWFPIPPLPQ